MTIRETLETKLARFEELERAMSDPKVLADSTRMAAVARNTGRGQLVTATAGLNKCRRRSLNSASWPTATMRKSGRWPKRNSAVEGRAGAAVE